MPEAIGIDLGGTKTAAGVVDETGVILRRAEAPSDIGSPERLRDTVLGLARELGTSSAAGVGIGAAGVIDYARGHYLYGPNTGLRDIPLVDMLTRALSLPVRMDNDANCAAWAEHRFGAGRGTRHFLCVTLGTGIGGGLVLDGRPYRGAHGGAAEIGHMLVDPDGHPCGCGRNGCWEQYASGQALERIATERLPGHPKSLIHEILGADARRVPGRTVAAAAHEGDPFALEVFAEVARWVGWGLASLVNIFEPELIAISGGLVAAWELMADAVVDATRSRVEAPEFRPLPDIVPAALGADAGIVGAASLVFARSDAEA